MKPEAKKWMLCLLANSAILLTLYFWIPAQFQFAYMPIIYLVAGAVLLLGYVIYNRGMIGKNLTPEQLPDSMTLAEKQAMIDDLHERAHRSRCVLTVIFPIALTFAVDMIYLFLIPSLTGGLG